MLNERLFFSHSLKLPPPYTSNCIVLFFSHISQFFSPSPFFIFRSMGDEKSPWCDDDNSMFVEQVSLAPSPPPPSPHARIITYNVPIKLSLLFLRIEGNRVVAIIVYTFPTLLPITFFSPHLFLYPFFVLSLSISSSHLFLFPRMKGEDKTFAYLPTVPI